jgi:hypothetical protein
MISVLLRTQHDMCQYRASLSDSETFERPQRLAQIAAFKTNLLVETYCAWSLDGFILTSFTAID